MGRDHSMPMQSPAAESTLVQHAIAIVGGGFSGTLLAIQLLRMGLAKSDSVVLIEKNLRMGPGLAYSVEDECCLLNVPAGNMSALADDPEHFLRYCQTIDATMTSSSFVPRRLYGQYIEQLLCETEKLHPQQLHRLCASVVDLELISGDRCRLDFANHTSIFANKVVLALGHFASPPLVALKSLPADMVIAPWDVEQFQKIPLTSPIAILGIGHTAIDALLRLQINSDIQKVYLMSRRGLVPNSHRLASNSVDMQFPKWLKNIPVTARAYTSALRGQIKKHYQEGGDWRDIFNQIRAHTSEIWQSLPTNERARFLSQLLPYWDVHRHRLAPSIANQIEKLQQQGTIEVIAGRIESAQMQGKLINIQYLDRATQEMKLIKVGAIINCTGPNYNLATVPDPFVQSLIRRNYLRQDLHKIGLELNDQYQLQNPIHLAQQQLYYIGPMLKAYYWESIAVPELRVHVQRLAKQLLQKR
jgi:uncharacterized NAD(P)/FAD-binding protein YdhS